MGFENPDISRGIGTTKIIYFGRSVVTVANWVEGCQTRNWKSQMARTKRIIAPGQGRSCSVATTTPATSEPQPLDCLPTWLTANSPEDVIPIQGSLGTHSPWFGNGSMQLTGTILLIGDLSYIGNTDDCETVMLEPGEYQLAFRLVAYGADRRLAALRASTTIRGARLGKRIGTTYTDVGTTALCDATRLAKVPTSKIKAFERAVYQTLNRAEIADVVKVPGVPGFEIACYQSGFGDGEFEIQEITLDGKRTGIHIQFIKPRQRYPFSLQK